MAPRLDFDTYGATFSRALSHLDHAATQQLDAVDFDRRLRELVRIRASQLNGCAYCIDMHTKDARAAGETEQRIYALTAWRETPFFSEPERAALAFTEAMTLMSEDHVPQSAFDVLTPHYSPEEIAALVSLIVMINAWNAVGVSTRAWEPGSYSIED
jgi:AhpD family alkylhydroperoxidase